MLISLPTSPNAGRRQWCENAAPERLHVHAESRHLLWGVRRSRRRWPFYSGGANRAEADVWRLDPRYLVNRTLHS